MFIKIILYLVFILVSALLALAAVYYKDFYLSCAAKEQVTDKKEKSSVKLEKSDDNEESEKSENDTEDTDDKAEKIVSQQNDESEDGEKSADTAPTLEQNEIEKEQTEKEPEAADEQESENLTLRKFQPKRKVSFADFKSVIKNSKTSVIIFMVCYVAAAVLGVTFREYKQWPVIVLAQYLLVWQSMFLAANIDLKVKKIPNKLILFMLGIRALGIVGQVILAPAYWMTYILFSVVGLLVGGLVILICYFISRGGVGSGDMKMFATIGFFFGLSGVMEMMVYSLFLACIVSIVLLVSRKAKFKSSLPMAPFVFIGLSLYLFFL